MLRILMQKYKSVFFPFSLPHAFSCPLSIRFILERKECFTKYNKTLPTDWIILPYQRIIARFRNNFIVNSLGTTTLDMLKLPKLLLGILLSAMVTLATGQNPLILSVTCRNYGKVLLRGQLDDCVPENFRCFLRNPIVVNSTELICIMDNENAASKTPLVICVIDLTFENKIVSF